MCISCIPIYVACYIPEFPVFVLTVTVDVTITVVAASTLRVKNVSKEQIEVLSIILT